MADGWPRTLCIGPHARNALHRRSQAAVFASRSIQAKLVDRPVAVTLPTVAKMPLRVEPAQWLPADRSNGTPQTDVLGLAMRAGQLTLVLVN